MKMLANRRHDAATTRRLKENCEQLKTFDQGNILQIYVIFDNLPRSREVDGKIEKMSSHFYLSLPQIGPTLFEISLVVSLALCGR